MVRCCRLGMPLLSALVIATFFAGTLPAAIVYDIDLDPNDDLYGTLDQDDVKVGPGDSGVNSCAPTATMNSFTYLQNAYPNVYGMDDELMGVSTSWLDAAIDLAENYMFTTSDNGTSDADWINGKYNYLEEYAPGKTIYAGYDEFTTGGQPWVTQGIPSINFIIEQLQLGANIEIGISPSGAGIGHVLTVSSLHWIDEDEDGIFDEETEDATIDGTDPGDGEKWEYSLKLVTNEESSYLGFDGGPYNDYRIDAALAEVAVPEPGTILLLAMSAAALFVFRRRRAG